MYFEDLEEGKIYKSISAKPISGTEIDIVSQLSKLDVPAFLDANFAKRWGYKDRVTPGAYIIACMLGLMKDIVSDAIWIAANEISFKSPVFPGDIISAEIEILDKRESRRGGIVNYLWRVRNQNEVLVAEGKNT